MTLPLDEIKISIHIISIVFLMVVYFKTRYALISLGKSKMSKSTVIIGGLILLVVLINYIELSVVSAIGVVLALLIRRRKLKKLCN